MDGTLVMLDAIIKKLDLLEKKIEQISTVPAEVVTTEQKAFTIKEMMELLQIGKSKAYELLQTGEVRSFKVGWEYRIPKKALDDYMNSKN